MNPITFTFTQNEDGSFPSQFVVNNDTQSVDEYIVAIKASVSASSIQDEINAQNKIISDNNDRITAAQSDEAQEVQAANALIDAANATIASLNTQLNDFNTKFPQIS